MLLFVRRVFFFFFWKVWRKSGCATFCWIFFPFIRRFGGSRGVLLFLLKGLEEVGVYFFIRRFGGS